MVNSFVAVFLFIFFCTALNGQKTKDYLAVSVLKTQQSKGSNLLFIAIRNTSDSTVWIPYFKHRIVKENLISMSDRQFILNKDSIGLSFTEYWKSFYTDSVFLNHPLKIPVISILPGNVYIAKMKVPYSQMLLLELPYIIGGQYQRNTKHFSYYLFRSSFYLFLFGKYLR